MLSKISSSSSFSDFPMGPSTIQPSKLGRNVKAGGYAVTTQKTMSWLNTPVKQSKTRGRKHGTQQTIVNEIFSLCSDMTDDTFWKKILAQCSYGKFPRGFSYRNGFLMHKRGTKVLKVQVLDSDIEEAYDIITTFFRNESGLRSQKDTEREHEISEEQIRDYISLEQCEWSELRTKVQKQLIQTFISTIIKNEHLTSEQGKMLTSFINIGFMLKYFDKSSVVYVKGVVVGINGLARDLETGTFILDSEKINQTVGNKNKVKIVTQEEYTDLNYVPVHLRLPKVSFLNQWISFLNTLSKNTKTQQTHTRGLSSITKKVPNMSATNSESFCLRSESINTTMTEETEESQEL